MRGLSPLFITTTIRSFAFSMLGIFTPLYLVKVLLTYPLFASNKGVLLGVAVYFVIFDVSVLLFNYLAIRLIQYLHFRWVMVLGSLFSALDFLFLIWGQNGIFFLVLSAISGGLSTPFFWNSFHAIFIEDGRQKSLGRDLSTQGVLGQLAGIAGPALGGVIITFFGFNLVFTLGLILISISSLPIFLMPHHPKFVLPKFSRLIKEFPIKKFCKDLTSLAAVGAEDCIGGVFWPIFVFSIIGSYEVFGFVSAGVGIVSLLTMIFVGQLIDKKSKTSILTIGGIACSLTWLARMLIKTTSQVFFVDSVGSVVSKFWILPFDALIYKKAEDSVLINYLVFREWAFHVGSLLSLILVIILITLGVNFLVIFALAAIATLLSIVIAI